MVKSDSVFIFGKIFFSSDGNAFQVYIGNPGEFPFLRNRAVQIQPGYENHVEVSAIQISADPNIMSHGIEDRKCQFYWEGELEFHEYYSYTSCVLEYAMAQVAISMLLVNKADIAKMQQKLNSYLWSFFILCYQWITSWTSPNQWSFILSSCPKIVSIHGSAYQQPWFIPHSYSPVDKFWPDLICRIRILK